MRLEVKVSPSLTLQLMNSTSSSCVELLCSLQGLEPQRVNFTWIRAAQLLHHYNSSNMSSFLKLCKPNWTDGDTLTCRALYPINDILYMKNITLPSNSGSPVHFIVTGTLLGLLIGAALFIEVYYQCHIACHGQSTADGNDTS
ncbi:hypothetical protein QTP70_018280 [Hemibagrus guttatus]|uniref:Ig-like domain-containing protein n=1 Tax=Hemibagrus guttatus TaxID=175788 RepID=A0AAE0QIE5_9TELE|nr:hypothetical protein QTP70_018280 [Hemibagrus guttatus]